MKIEKDIAIIGSGPVGIFSAFQAGMLGMSSCIIDALDTPGGQCSALYPEKPIYDIPGYPNILAQELVDKLVQQSDPFKPEYLLSRKVVGMDFSKSYHIRTSVGDDIIAKSVIIAAGAGCFGPNRPPLNDIELYENESIFYSVPKIEKFKNKKIIIAGGGDSAVDWAIALSEIADVTIVHRRKKFRAAPASIQKMEELSKVGKIKIVTNFQLHSLKGDGEILSSVIVSDLDNNTKQIEADFLLPFYGLSQDLSLIENCGIEVNNHHIHVNYPYFETSIPGVYAVGDVATYEGKLKLILTGFAEVSSALHHAYNRVFDGKPLRFEYSTSKGVK